METTRVSSPIPVSAGIGLRAPHYRDVIERRPRIGWWEVHSENYFGAGGPPHHYLEQIRAEYPLSLHGVGLSLGSVDGLNRNHLQKLKALIERYEPGLVSEHLSWSAFNGQYLNDLLPLPYTEEALSLIVERIGTAQDFLGCRLLIENPSSYLQYVESSIPEHEFLREVSERADCGLLLDVNNVYVSAANHGFDAMTYIRALPPARVQEIHLAGHTMNRYEDGEILIDTHNAPVGDAVWRLYEQTLHCVGARPTLIEWDTDLPPLATLLAEAQAASTILEAGRVAA